MRTIFFVLLYFFCGTLLFSQEDIQTLTNKDFDKLNKGKVITKKRRKDGKIIVIAQGIVVGKSRAIYDVIMKCDKHTDFMPNFKACESFFENADSAHGKTVVDPPMTKKDIVFHTFTRYKYTERYSKITWKLDAAGPHPKYINDTFGFWEIQELGEDQHLLSFYSNSDFKFHWSINWFLEPIFKTLMKNSLPGMVRNVRARVETEEIWAMKGPIPEPKISLINGGDSN